MRFKTPLTAADAEALAARWQTTPQTIYSWRKKGVAIHDPASVINFLTESKNPTARQLEAAHRELQALTEKFESPKL
jgi:hypothetical protein